jgi:hypothetical protein
LKSKAGAPASIGLNQADLMATDHLKLRRLSYRVQACR